MFIVNKLIMKYLFKSLQQIIDIFKEEEKLWATEISEKIWKSKVIVHKYLKELVKQWKLKKVWEWPKTKYIKNFNISKVTKINIDNIEDDYILSFQDQKLLDEIFLKFTPEWKILKWFDWIKKWCKERNLDTKNKIQSYLDIYKYVLSIQNSCWLINSKDNFWKDFEKVYLDRVYYSDQYKRMDFWRWKLAEMTFYAKQSQNTKLISESIDEISYKLECIIKQEKYDAIAITPWSIDRKNQLLKILKNRIKDFKLPFINIIKYYSSWIIIPQKSLKTRKQRIQNAKNTIFIDDKNIKKYKKVFLIDDFVWSGATLNETAKKLKDEWIKKVDWFAFVWNLNLSYDIINEI